MSSHGDETVGGGWSEAQFVRLSSQLPLSLTLLIRRLLNLLLQFITFLVSEATVEIAC